jgi:NitT/TauT family transport system ATP-binding protein
LDKIINSSPASAEKSFIRLDRVSLSYDQTIENLAVKELNLDVSKGQFVAVVGPSGCGKSSLMKLLTGLIKPTSGRIEYAGAQVTGPLNCVGMAFQNPTLLPWRHLMGNVLLPFEIVREHRQKYKADKEPYKKKAQALLETVGLTGFETCYPWMLSGGMQQRANLCRSIIHEPDLLMLDEPFGALDAFTREELWITLQDLWLRRRFTCMLVTHDLIEAAFLADVVYVMSPRPGSIYARYEIDLPRPRQIESIFDPHFTSIVKQIRADISTLKNKNKQGVGQ